MAKQKPMTDDKLVDSLKYVKQARIIKNYFEKEDSTATKKIKAEFKRRKISAYTSETVDADVTTAETYPLNDKQIFKDYTIEELRKMGVLRIDPKKFKEKSKLTEDELKEKKYVSKKPGKKQLNITLKPDLSEEYDERIREIMEKLTGAY
jgi:hypothetical protein